MDCGTIQSRVSFLIILLFVRPLKPKIIGMAESLDINSKTIQALETVLVLGVVTTTAIGEILVVPN